MWNIQEGWRHRESWPTLIYGCCESGGIFQLQKFSLRSEGLQSHTDHSLELQKEEPTQHLAVKSAGILSVWVSQNASGNTDILLKSLHKYYLLSGTHLRLLCRCQTHGERASGQELEGQLPLPLCWSLLPYDQIWICIILVNSASSILMSPWDLVPPNLYTASLSPCYS